MVNILTAILNIYNCPVYNTGIHYYAKNRANNMGDALEHFIKDSFANSYSLSDEAIERIPEISILDKNIKSPDNPAIMKRVKIITFSR